MVQCSLIRYNILTTGIDCIYNMSHWILQQRIEFSTLIIYTRLQDKIIQSELILKE